MHTDDALNEESSLQSMSTELHQQSSMSHAWRDGSRSAGGDCPDGFAWDINAGDVSVMHTVRCLVRPRGMPYPCLVLRGVSPGVHLVRNVKLNVAWKR